jgi:hypothetical protein
VVDIDMPVQNDDSVYGFNRPGDPVNRFTLAALAEVWYTLNQAIFGF